MSKIKVKKSVKLNQVKPTRMKRRFGIDVNVIRDLQQDYTIELDEKVARKMAKERYVIIVDDVEPKAIVETPAVVEDEKLSTVDDSKVFTPEDDLDDLDESNEVTIDDEENVDSNEDDNINDSEDSDEDEQEQY